MIEKHNDIYKELNIRKVSDNKIVIDDTNDRKAFFMLFFYLFIVFPLALEIFSYNRQHLIEFIFTFSLLIIAIILLVFKDKICYKKVIIDRTKQQIVIERNVLYIRQVFNFKKSELLNTSKMQAVNGDVFPKKKVFIRRLGEDKKYLLKTYHNECVKLDIFIHNYMKFNKDIPIQTISNFPCNLAFIKKRHTIRFSSKSFYQVSLKHDKS